MTTQTIRRILVAIKDPQAPAPATVAKAAALAHALKAELVLFHDIDLPIYTAAYVSDEQQLGDTEDSVRTRYLHALEEHAGSLRASGLAVSVMADWDFPAYEAILRAALRCHADLVVAEHHRGASSALWALHPDDWELLRLSLVPVLLVKDPQPYRQPVILAAVDPMHAHAKPAELDQDILRLAESVSHALGGTWHAVHAHHPAAVSFPGSSAASDAASSSHAGVRSEARAAMDGMLDSISSAPASIQLIDRPPAEAIVESASSLHVSIIVMGVVSRSGLKGLLIGNTAEQVLDRVSCDLLIVKPQNFRIRFSQDRRGPNLQATALALPL
ncbi:MAG TPA: universal stress protein [Steroidobacteraceae bacterium]|jgi:universal stress protein E|nr:universal stress protein [Steroidobacteraceae bacterium]